MAPVRRPSRPLALAAPSGAGASAADAARSSRLLRAAERFRRASAERRRRASAPAQAPQADPPSPGEDDPAAERDARP